MTIEEKLDELIASNQRIEESLKRMENRQLGIKEQIQETTQGSFATVDHGDR